MTEIDGLEIHFIHVRSKQLYPAPRSWTQQTYPKLIHYNKLDKGGHFAAWEQPQLFFRRGSRGFQTASEIDLNASWACCARQR